MSIELERVEAGYRPGLPVLKDITMYFDKGFLVILGPNGAGKTTLLAVVSGFLEPWRGECRVFRKKCSSLVHEGFNDLALSFEKPPYVRAGVSHLYSSLCLVRPCDWSKFYELLEVFGLKPSIVLRRQFHKLSAGERMKTYLSIVLSLPSKLYILDEPNSNLDPESRGRLRSILAELLRRGSSFIVTTHVYEYVEDIATHIAVINKGELLFYDRVDRALKDYAEGKCIVRVRTSLLKDYLEWLRGMGYRYRVTGENLVLVESCTRVDRVAAHSAVLSISLASLETLYRLIVGGGNL